ncbi:DUF4268 domain-containing protein [Aquimarina intermedia]|uniref:Uncharacterized protein DUF4268 n=1 Tax=Aquimarina intermedia TaxID=350814 RepID=A0A5S5BWC9_9FLAO|nr:DUF4268 domain-containing protein [Aquimarina intermedia]TYP69923.1 uncharacterized protein DUF4268 [Aquimarina intermedia]
MFSKEQSKHIRQQFWIRFGKAYPRKWLLYNTKIKDVSLKFYFSTKQAQVSIDIEQTDELLQAYYFDKLVSLQSILKENYGAEYIFDDNYTLENGKVISRVYITKGQVSIHNPNTWEDTMLFLNHHMEQLEDFFVTYQDFIES